MRNEEQDSCDSVGCSGMTVNSEEVLEKVRIEFKEFMMRNLHSTRQGVRDSDALRGLETDHNAAHALGLDMLVNTFLFGQISNVLVNNMLQIVIKTTNEIGKQVEEWNKENQ